MGKTPWECLITVSMKKSASTVLWTRFKILMLRVFMCRFSPKRYLWCSAPVLSIGPIIIPLTLFMIFDCDKVGGCGWYETLSYGSIWTLVLLNCPCWWWWRHRCCCCRLIGTPPPHIPRPIPILDAETGGGPFSRCWWCTGIRGRPALPRPHEIVR